MGAGLRVGASRLGLAGRWAASSAVLTGSPVWMRIAAQAGFAEATLVARRGRAATSVLRLDDPLSCAAWRG